MSEERMYGSMPIGRLFIKCAVPGVISMLVWSLCSIVDGIFVGNILGGDALAAVNMAWPLITMSTCISEMVAAGSSVRVALCLGNGDREGARVIFTNSVSIIFAVSVVFMFVGMFGAGALLSMMGADSTLSALGAEYIWSFAVLAPVSLFFFATDNYLRICGKVNFSMYINILVAVLNIVLEFIFLVILDWGLWAASMATSLSLTIGAVISLVPFVRKQLSLWFVRGYMGNGNLWNVVYNGSSTFFNSVSGAVYMLVANIILLDVAGVSAVSAFGIIMYINSVALVLFSGMSTSVQPALSYNHGSGDGVRVGQMVKVLTIASVVMAVLATVLISVFNEGLVGLFIGDEPEVLTVAIGGMSIFVLTYLTTWMSINVNQILTAVDRPGSSLIIGILSQMVLPIAFMIPMASMGLDGIWWSTVIASAFSLVISVVFLVRIHKEGIFTMHDPIPGFTACEN